MVICRFLPDGTAVVQPRRPIAQLEILHKENCIIGITGTEAIECADSVSGLPFVSRDNSKRTNPAKILANAKCVLTVAMLYDKCKSLSRVMRDKIQKAFAVEGACGTFDLACLSSLGTCVDYHGRLRKILKEIADYVKVCLGDFSYRILVDSPTLCERPLAVRAGLGFVGKNGMIITEEYGSFVNIGLLVTDAAIEDLAATISAKFGHTAKINPKPKSCPPKCRICIDACPNSALSESSPLDSSRCISYLTQKKELTPEEECLLHGQLYGCDICQDVCPMNNGRTFSHNISPRAILEASDEEIRTSFSHTAMNWRLDLLKRNAGIAASSLCKFGDFLR